VRTVEFTDERGLRWEVEEAYADAIRGAILPHLERLATAPGVSIVKRNRVRTVLRLRLEGGPVAMEEIYLKRYHPTGIRAKLKSMVRPPRARREWEMARTIEENGIPTAHPIAWAVKRRRGVVTDAVYVCRGLPDALDYVPWILKHAPKPEDTADHLLRRRHLERLARLARRQHDLGFDHPDMHSGNLLFVPDESQRDGVALHVIDLHAASARKGPLEAGRRLVLLSKLLHSLLEVTNDADRYRFLRDYASGDGSPFADLRRVHEAIERRVTRLERLRLRSRSKRCMKRSGRFDVARAEGWLVRHLRSQPLPSLLEAAREHDRALREDVRVVKRGKRSFVTKARIRGPKGERTVVVKETRPKPLRAWLGPVLGRSRGRRGWMLGNALIVRDISAAKPLGYLLDAWGPLVRREILVMADVSDDGERLDHLVLRLFCETGLVGYERRILVGIVAAFVRDLHLRGVYHGDLKACNVYVQTRADGALDLLLVDYERVRLDRTPGFRRRVKNLAQLHASIPRCISRADRLRFFRAYAPTPEIAKDWKRHVRAVLASCEKKIVVGMEPIE
jgi:tRNA A-37 threonylcarbamoyl transferase component Bud32